MEDEINLLTRAARKSTPVPFTATPPPASAIEFSQSLKILAELSAILLGLVGVVGKLLTVVALTRDKKLGQQATTFFVISLVISDQLFCALNSQEILVQKC